MNTGLTVSLNPMRSTGKGSPTENKLFFIGVEINLQFIDSQDTLYHIVLRQTRGGFIWKRQGCHDRVIRNEDISALISRHNGTLSKKSSKLFIPQQRQGNHREKS
jgi:hypothetical protein